GNGWAENGKGPSQLGPLALRFPPPHGERFSGRLGTPLLRAVTVTFHVVLSSPGVSQSPTPTARQQNCSGSRGWAFVMGTAARFEVHVRDVPNGHPACARRQMSQDSV